MATYISNMYEAACNQQVECNKKKLELFLTSLSYRHFLARSRRGKGFFFIGFVVVGSLRTDDRVEAANLVALCM
jgi:hypothetical protein